jgi:hypothetical protein
MSKVISPIDLRAFIESRLAGPTQVELYGEDGRLLYRKTLRTYSFDGQDARLALMIPFEVHAAGELPGFDERLQSRAQGWQQIPLLPFLLHTTAVH